MSTGGETTLGIGTVAAIAVGGSTLVFAVISAVGFVILRRRRQHSEESGTQRRSNVYPGGNTNIQGPLSARPNRDGQRRKPTSRRAKRMNSRLQGPTKSSQELILESTKDSSATLGSDSYYHDSQQRLRPVRKQHPESSSIPLERLSTAETPAHDRDVRARKSAVRERVDVESLIVESQSSAYPNWHAGPTEGVSNRELDHGRTSACNREPKPTPVKSHILAEGDDEQRVDPSNHDDSDLLMSLSKPNLRFSKPSERTKAKTQRMMSGTYNLEALRGLASTPIGRDPGSVPHTPIPSLPNQFPLRGREHRMSQEEEIHHRAWSMSSRDSGHSSILYLQDSSPPSRMMPEKSGGHRKISSQMSTPRISEDLSIYERGASNRNTVEVTGLSSPSKRPKHGSARRQPSQDEPGSNDPFGDPQISTQGRRIHENSRVSLATFGGKELFGPSPSGLNAEAEELRRFSQSTTSTTVVPMTPPCTPTTNDGFFTGMSAANWTAKSFEVGTIEEGVEEKEFLPNDQKLADISGNVVHTSNSRKPPSSTIGENRTSHPHKSGLPAKSKSIIKIGGSRRRGHKRHNCVRISTLSPNVFGDSPDICDSDETQNLKSPDNVKSESPERRLSLSQTSSAGRFSPIAPSKVQKVGNADSGSPGTSYSPTLSIYNSYESSSTRSPPDFNFSFPSRRYPQGVPSSATSVESFGGSSTFNRLSKTVKPRSPTGTSPDATSSRKDVFQPRKLASPSLAGDSPRAPRPAEISNKFAAPKVRNMTPSARSPTSSSSPSPAQRQKSVIRGPRTPPLSRSRSRRVSSSVDLRKSIATLRRMASDVTESDFSFRDGADGSQSTENPTKKYLNFGRTTPNSSMSLRHGRRSSARGRHSVRLSRSVTAQQFRISRDSGESPLTGVDALSSVSERRVRERVTAVRDSRNFVMPRPRVGQSNGMWNKRPGWVEQELYDGSGFLVR